MQPRTRRQKEVLEYITKYIDKHGYEPSYQQIAWHLGVASKAGIAKHISALENQGLLARRRENGSFNIEVRPKESFSETVCRIEWLDAPTDTSYREDWENQPLFVPKFLLGYLSPDKVYAFRVPNDSMFNKGIFEGDVILIEKRTFVRDGDCIAATIEKKRTIVKNYYRVGAYIELRPANERYETLRLSADKIEIQGVYRGLLRPLI
ncbi:MAG: LexA repressor, repressor LexA [Acidobacteria bacterium]|jgi:repressor LexA|nr:LexA repressor, repressor LexA [Acidobacteriota bacterium]